MSVCKTCGKEYNRWTTPVSARGVCGDCFEAELAQEKAAKQQVLADPPVSVAYASEQNVDTLSEESPSAAPVPVDVIVETLGVILVFFGGGILLNWLGGESKSIVTTQGLVAHSLTDIGWILVVICLLNRSAGFQWQLPTSKKAWFTEFGWGTGLFLISILGRFIVIALARELHVGVSPSIWAESLRNHNTWVAFQIITPLSATYQELVCRVYVQSRLTQILRDDSTFVVLISSWLFAAVHGYALLGSINVFVVGLILGTSYQLNAKIPRLVIAHAANNLIAGFFVNPG